MKSLRARRAGFTLIELLVVMAIITVLIAIALPVFSRAREKARQTACMANLHQLAMAVRMYRMDMGHFPGPYDPVTGEGGLNALYPAYLDNRKALICPDDLMESGEQYVAQSARFFTSAGTYTEIPYTDLLLTASSLYMDLDPSGEYWINLWTYNKPNPPSGAEYAPGFFTEHYSSYNNMYNWVGYVGEAEVYSLCDYGNQYLNVGDNLAFWYLWHCWDPNNDLGVWTSSEVFNTLDSYLQYHLGQQTYWFGYDGWNLDEGERFQDSLNRGLWDPGSTDSLSWDYMPYGMPSPVFPGLINRNAPDNTIITRCTHHRPYTVKRILIKREGPPEGKGPHPPSFQTEIEYDTESPQDIVLRLDGSAQMVVGLNYDWATQSRSTQ